jgi:uncharacterized membrane protein YdbT with pleckstrin-like domain
VRRRREVRYETRRHGVVLARPLVRALVLVGGGIALVVAGEPVAWPLGVAGAILAALGALAALRAVLAWDRTKVVVTENELLVVHGVVRRRMAAVELGPGSALEIEQSLLGRLLGYGTVLAGDLEIPYVPDPRRLRRVAA